MKFVKKENSNVSPDFVIECSKKFNVTPIIMEQIIARGNDTVEKIREYLNPSENSFHDPFKLQGMKELCERIEKAKENKDRILIFGDYDVDGVSATAIMIKTLRIMGFSPKYYLPNRYIDGYGLTNQVIDKIKAEFDPSLILTVDCGISCWQEVEYAKSLGIEIIVTDHHEIPEKLPQTIVLNAKLPNQEYGFDGLCGTGLAYKISQALIGEKSKEMLPIACIATIADIVPLVDENRAIVHFGLKQLNKLPIGLKFLFKALGINLGKCVANEISFKVAPKLNASGRMGDAKDSLKLYLTENVGEIKQLVEKINTHNTNRRNLCTVVEKDCIDILNRMDVSAPCIILSSYDWDQGILGITCAKLVGIYNRPVFLFSEKDGELVGSARSIRGINIHELLSSMKDILESYGGHPLAAGLTIKAENFDKFINRVNEYLLTNYEPEIFVPKEYYDIEVSTEELTPKFVKDLQLMEPTGSENEILKLFIKTQKYSFKPMKNYYCHCNFKIDNTLPLVNFNCSHIYPKLRVSKEVNIIFEPQIDSGYNKSIRGIIKAIDCDFESVASVGKVDVLPLFEQLRFTGENNEAKFTFFNLDSKGVKVDSHFGTAFVVNSEHSYKKFLELADCSKVNKFDVCNGAENSGLNCLFVCPSKIDFARSYSKIIFLDPVADMSYISKINQISRAEVFVPNKKFSSAYYKNLDISREKLGGIYRHISSSTGNYNNLGDVYNLIKHRKTSNFTYKEFYFAFMVFEELGFLSFEKAGDSFNLKINKSVKSDLANSKIYQAVSGFKNKGE